MPTALSLLQQPRHRSAPSLSTPHYRRRFNGSIVRPEPFNRQMWLERENQRRQADYVARHVPRLRQVSVSHSRLRSYEEVVAGVAALNAGGQLWLSWSQSSLGTTSTKSLVSSYSQPSLVPHRAAPIRPAGLAEKGESNDQQPVRAPFAPRSQTFSREADMRSSFVKSTAESISAHFQDLTKAFKYFDVDKSGTLQAKEIRRAFKAWRMPIDNQQVRLCAR